MNDLRQQALEALILSNPAEKYAATQVLCLEHPINPSAVFKVTQLIPGREAKPELVAPQKVKHYSMRLPEGRAAFIHALTHIEFNAINLALDIIWRFPELPEKFYRDWIKVAQEEAQHFQMLRQHLQSLGYDYGDFTAHDGLWEMAEKTKDDVLARLALVPRTLEARGLDVSPALRDKLISVGDRAGAKILEIILKDEIGHVSIGNYWYKWLCSQLSLDPILTYEVLAQRYGAPKLRGPFNLEARRAAGFNEMELAALAAS